jgi:hypothetical protein
MKLRFNKLKKKRKKKKKANTMISLMEMEKLIDANDSLRKELWRYQTLSMTI